jgi:hypothetical protein
VTEPDRTDEPVAGFGRFTWRTGRWEEIFDRQIAAIKAEIAHAHAEDRMVVYLSCPISTRGGGSSRTNVEVANFTARRLMHTWGERLFVLNPAAYQMESREGTGLILERIREIWPEEESPERFLKELTETHKPGGGDYMRMWVKVLAEDDRYPDPATPETAPRRGLQCGGMFDAFYFLGPSDVREFFSTQDDESLTQMVEGYFARKYASDLEFRLEFGSEPDGKSGEADASWEVPRKRFLRYYSLRAGATYSLGCRDEWNTLVRLNEKRRRSEAYGPGEELACFFDGRQVSPAASAQKVPLGYETTEEVAQATPPREIAWPAGFVVPEP